MNLIRKWPALVAGIAFFLLVTALTAVPWQDVFTNVRVDGRLKVKQIVQLPGSIERLSWVTGDVSKTFTLTNAQDDTDFVLLFGPTEGITVAGYEPFSTTTVRVTLTGHAVTSDVSQSVIVIGGAW